MVMHACQIGPTNNCASYLGSPHRACIGTWGNASEQATFLSPFLHLLFVGESTPFHLEPWLRYYRHWVQSNVDDQPGSSFVLELLDGGGQEDGEVRIPYHNACQSNKGGHLVLLFRASYGRFYQHNQSWIKTLNWD